MSCYLSLVLFSQQVNGQNPTVELKIVPVFLQKNAGLHEQQGLRTFPDRSQLQTVKKSIDLKDHTELKKQPDLVEASDPAKMLSSSMVTVLAPHWSGRLRRNKRFEGTGATETQDGTNGQEHQVQEPTDMLLADRSQGQLKVPLMVTRWNTVGDSVGNEQKRSLIQTGSLDANLGRSDNLKRERGVLDTGQRRHPQTGLQEGLLSTNSIPTTSSLLLSLRKCNSNDRSPIATPLRSDRTELTTRQDSKTLPPLPSCSYRTTETGTGVFSSSSVDNRNRTAFETRLFSGPPVNKNTPFTQESQTTLTSSLSSPRNSLYDHSPLQQRQSLPRRTTLTSTSWWKQVTQDSCSPSTNITDKTDTPSVRPCHDKSGLRSPNPNEGQTLNDQILNRGMINTTELLHKSSINLDKKASGGTPDLKLKKTEDPPNQRADKLIKEQFVSSINTREPQNLQSMPSHPNNLSKYSGRSFTTNLNQLPPPLLRFESKNTPSDVSTKYNNNHISSNPKSLMSFQNKDSQSYIKHSPPISIGSSANRQDPTCHAASTVPATTNTSPLFSSKPVDLQASVQPVSSASSRSQPSKFTKSVDTTPLGFERSYSAIPEQFHSNQSRISILTKTNSVQYRPVTTAHMVFSSTSNNHPATTTAPSSSPLTQPTNHTLSSSPTTISSLLTPPATPVITSPKTLLRDPEKDTTKQSGKSKEKRERRVTWDDSVDWQCSDSDTVEKSEQSEVLSPARSSVSIKAPAIFSFLRQSNPPNKPPPRSPTPKSSNIQVTKAGKCRSFSSDAVDSPSTHWERSQQMTSDCLPSEKELDLSTPRHGRTLSMESGTTHYRSSVPLSLPADFSSGYKHRYSSPPYTALMTSRSTQGEAENHKTITPRSLLFQQTSMANYSTHNDSAKVKAITLSRPSMSPVSPQEPLTAHSQNKVSTREGLKIGTLDIDKLENRNRKNISQDSQKGKILLINNRVHIYSQSLPGDQGHRSSPALVTETLVYSFKPKADFTTAVPTSIVHTPFQQTPNTAINFKTKLSQKSQIQQSKEGSGQSQQGSSSGSSTGSQARDKESLRNKVKDSMICKGKFFSVDCSNEQVPKRGKKSSNTPSSNLTRSDSDRANKTNNKMDQVFNKLKQTFSTRRSEDDMSFLWKRKKNSQTPSVSGSSDISSVSDVSLQSAKTMAKQEEKKKAVPTGHERGTGDVYQWPQSKYIIVPPSDPGVPVTGDVSFPWSDKSLPNTDQDKQFISAEIISKKQTHLIHSPTPQQFDFYDDSVTDYKPTNEFLSYKDCSPGRNTSPSTVHPPQHEKPASCPRSPFSPFSSLSPLPSLPTSDGTEDSVFYSPKLQRRKESSSPCEPVQGYSLGNSRRSRASIGPPSVCPLKDNERLSPSYADLKYGIEPGRSFSVSSVLSSRPSGPGRISTGSRHMSLGNLCESTLTCAGNSKDVDWSNEPDWGGTYNLMPSKKLKDYYASDPNRMRSRSLPRSLTRHLADWGPVPPPGHNITSKSTHLWNSNREPQHFIWDTEGPPTPPPTPPLSPVVRRMSKASSVSSPTFPGPSRATQHTEGMSSRGNSLPRSYMSSLGTFEENSDSSSDTTTDDEYYLETGDMEEKETEL